MMKFSDETQGIPLLRGDLFIFVILAMMAAFAAIPMVLAISNALNH